MTTLFHKSSKSIQVGFMRNELHHLCSWKHCSSLAYVETVKKNELVSNFYIEKEILGDPKSQINQLISRRSRKKQ